MLRVSKGLGRALPIACSRWLFASGDAGSWRKISVDNKRRFGRKVREMQSKNGVLRIAAAFLLVLCFSSCTTKPFNAYSGDQVSGAALASIRVPNQTLNVGFGQYSWGIFGINGRKVPYESSEGKITFSPGQTEIIYGVWENTAQISGVSLPSVSHRTIRFNAKAGHKYVLRVSGVHGRHATITETKTKNSVTPSN